jgi:ribonuclease HI
VEFTDFVQQEVQGPTDTGSCWKKVREMKGFYREPDAILISDGVRLRTLKEKANIFLKLFGDTNNTNCLPQEAQDYREKNKVTSTPDLSTESNTNTINKPFAVSELCKALAQIKKKGSAPGSDPVSYRVLREMPPVFIDILNQFYNLCWSTGLTPTSWRKADVVPVPKQGKARSNPKNYRPISLTPNIGKLYEKMIKVRLDYFCEKKGIIPKFQAGFRKRRSVTDHTVKLTAHIRKAISSNHAVVGTFFDIQRAFDSVWHNKLLSKLSSAGIEGRMLAFVTSFLSKRSIRVKYRGHFSEYRGIDMGVPQGSVIAPLLFSIMLSDITKLEAPQYSLNLFADDIAMWRTYRGRITRKSRQRDNWFKGYQDHVDKLAKYLENNGFVLAPEKCKLVIFGRRLIGKARKQITLNINGVEVPCSQTIKFLGVVFHQSLQWHLHIAHVIAKAKKKLNLLRCISRERWAGSGRVMINIATALVRSILLYGSECYNALRPHLLKRLMRVDVSSLRIALGLPSTSPHGLTYREAGILPFDSLVRLTSAKYVCRAGCVPNSTQEELWEPSQEIDKESNIPDLTSISDYIKPLLEPKVVKLPNPAVSLPPPFPDWELEEASYNYDYFKSCKAQEPNVAALEARVLLNTRYQNHLIIYTDGSRQAVDAVGAAFYIPELRLSYGVSLQAGASSYSAELMAIYMALEHFEPLIQPPSRICIASDSRAALIAIESGTTRERDSMVFEIRHMISGLTVRGCEISFLWVPSHVGIRGNERVDSLANQAALGLSYSAKIDIGLTANETGTLLKEKAWRMWVKEFGQEAKEKAWTVISEPAKKFCPALAGQRKKLLHRLRTNAWRYKFIADLKHCICGQGINIPHILMHCSARKAKITDLREALKAHDLQYNLENLLGSNPRTGWTIPNMVIDYLYQDKQGYLF